MRSGNAYKVYDLCLAQARADRVVRSTISSQLEPYNLTVMEWLALGVVAAGPRNGLNMSAIAKELHVTLPQVTVLVSKLTDAKLFKSRAQGTDKRAKFICATLRGRRLHLKLEGVVRLPNERLQNNIEAADLGRYIYVAEQIAESID